jgi:hypothetical protein
MTLLTSRAATSSKNWQLAESSESPIQTSHSPRQAHTFFLFATCWNGNQTPKKSPKKKSSPEPPPHRCESQLGPNEVFPKLAPSPSSSLREIGKIVSYPAPVGPLPSKQDVLARIQLNRIFVFVRRLVLYCVSVHLGFAVRGSKSVICSSSGDRTVR